MSMLILTEFSSNQPRIVITIPECDQINGKYQP